MTVPGVAPMSVGYDAHGRMSSWAQQSSTSAGGYEPQGYLASVTDPLSHTVSYTNDALGRPTRKQCLATTMGRARPGRRGSRG
jgi:YD repeat-containing protein